MICQVWVLTHKTVNHFCVHTASDHTASISSFFTHSNNGKHQSPCTAAVDQELVTPSLISVCCFTHHKLRNVYLYKSSSSRLCFVSYLVTLHYVYIHSFSPACSCILFSLFHCHYAPRHKAKHTHIHTHTFLRQAHAQSH